MKQQNIEKIIEQVEACKKSLKELVRTVNETTAREEHDETVDQLDASAELLLYNATANVLAQGGIAQLSYLKELIIEINKEDNK